MRTRVHTTTTASLQSSPGKLLCLSCFTYCKNSLVLFPCPWVLLFPVPGVLLFPCPFLTVMLILVWLDSQAPTLTATLICICSTSVLTAQNRGKLISFLLCPFLYSLMMLKINILIQSLCDSISLSIVESLLANFRFKFNHACVWLCFFLHWI